MQAMNPAIPALVQACERHAPLVTRMGAHVFAQVVAAMEMVKKTDVNIHEPWHWRSSGSNDRECTGLLKGKPVGMYYSHIAETSMFSLGVFVIPPGGKIPLHDHPRMCVLSKVLYGRAKIWSCDWLDESFQTGQLFARVVDEDVSFSEKSGLKILYPCHGGNIHEFSCQDSGDPDDPGVGCAILDLIIPPYSDSDGRFCTYFSRVPNELTMKEPSEKEVVRLKPTKATLNILQLN